MALHESSSASFEKATAAHQVNMLADPTSDSAHATPGGVANLQQSELSDMAVDVSSLGPLSTAMAALFAKMGVPIKTSVPLQILEAARSGTFRADLLPFSAAVAGRVDKSACQFYLVGRCIGCGRSSCAAQGYAVIFKFHRKGGLACTM